MQMHGVIELDGSGITALVTNHRKLGMSVCEIRNGSRHMHGAGRGLEIAVTLHAIGVARGGETYRPAMLGVASGAIGRETLIGMVNGAVVAIETGLIFGPGAEGAAGKNVTRGAFSRKHGMRGRYLSGAVNMSVARDSVPGKP